MIITILQLTYVFDNYSTLALAFLMSIWSSLFVKFWRRYQAELAFRWDVGMKMEYHLERVSLVC